MNNEKFLLYVAAASVTIFGTTFALNRCARKFSEETPKETKPQLEVGKLEVGKYVGMVNGKPAEYEVYETQCALTFKPEGEKAVRTTIWDTYCDNVADIVWGHGNYDRQDLLKAERAEQFDALLREGQKLVKPENKVKPDYQELDELLKP